MANSNLIDTNTVFTFTKFNKFTKHFFPFEKEVEN